jgi:hypothetical protein
MNRGLRWSPDKAFAGTRLGTFAGTFASTFAALLVALPAQGDVAEDRAALLDRAREPEQRLAALVRLQDRGQLDVAAAVAAMAGGDDEVARSAAAILRHEWVELPDALFRGLDDVPAAARALLQELAMAPRPAASAWAAARSGAGPGRTLDDRLLALAASGVALRAPDADLVLQALVDGSAGDGLRAALAVLPAPLADAQLGKLHAAFAGGRLDVARAAPLLDRLSPRGLRQLLGPIVALPPELATALCEHLHQSAPDLLAERVAAALDDPNELATCWLPYAAPHLDVAARRDRLLALLADPKQAPERREYAFLALSTARCVAPPVLAFATEEAGPMLERVRRLLAAATDELPAQQLLDWLAADEKLAAATVAALSTRRQLPEAAAMRLVDDLREAGLASGRYLFPAAMAVVLRGPEVAVRAVWPMLQRDEGFAQFVDALARRPEPFVGDLLAAGFPPAEGTPVEQVAPVALGPGGALGAGGRRVAAGTGAHAAGVVRAALRAPRADAARRRRAGPAGGGRLVADGAHRECDRRGVRRRTGRVGGRCGRRRRGRGPAAHGVDRVGRRPDRRRTARSGVAGAAAFAAARRAGRRTAHRARGGAVARAVRFARLRSARRHERAPRAGRPRALRRPGAAAAAHRSCARGRGGGALAARHQWLPAGRRGGAAAARQRAGGGGGGLRCGRAGGARRSAASHDLAAAPAAAVARTRLRRRAAGCGRGGDGAAGAGGGARAEDGELLGPVHWFAAHEAMARGDLPAAALQAKAAVAGLLRLPQQRGHARVFLGERDPGRGVDPWAALAALPHRLAAEAALATGDATAAAAAQARIREFAGRDHATLASLPLPFPETQR